MDPGWRIEAAETALGSGIRIDWAVVNTGSEPVALDRVAHPVPPARGRVLEHGYQSWSVVRRCDRDDVRPERRETRRWALACHLADPDGAGERVVGDQFLVHQGGIAGFVDARSHLSVVTPAGEAVALLDGLVLAPGERRALDPIWVAEGEPGPLYSEFAGHWGTAMDARAATPTPAGWCSWYRWFAGVTPEVVRANLTLAKELGLGIVQVDDGYQAHIGDWLDLWPTWQGEGSMATLAAEIHDHSVQPGLWTAPFLVGEDSALYASHPDWVATDDLGRPLRAMHNANNWGGWTFALDTTKPEVLAHLEATYRALRDQGWSYHKIDFCYAATVPGRRAGDGRLTRADSLRLGLEAVRRGIGDDAFLLGCGCPFGPAVGIVDAMRVSADVAPYWEPPASWPGFAESAPSAKAAIQASVLRAPLHRRLWANDPDCLLVRTSETSLDAGQRAMLADVIAGTGGFTIVSDDLSAYGEDERTALRDAVARGAAQDTPLTIVDPFATPVVVRGATHELVVDWDAPSGDAR